jgi:hypothetical protein
VKEKRGRSMKQFEGEERVLFAHSHTPRILGAYEIEEIERVDNYEDTTRGEKRGCFSLLLSPKTKVERRESD